MMFSRFEKMAIVSIISEQPSYQFLITAYRFALGVAKGSLIIFSWLYDVMNYTCYFIYFYVV